MARQKTKDLPLETLDVSFKQVKGILFQDRRKPRLLAVVEFLKNFRSKSESETENHGLMPVGIYKGKSRFVKRVQTPLGVYLITHLVCES